MKRIGSNSTFVVGMSELSETETRINIQSVEPLVTKDLQRLNVDMEALAET